MQGKVKLVGVTGLVMHNIRLADKDDPVTRQIAEVTSKKKRTDADNEDIARLEWQGGLYYDADLGVYVPSWNLLRCFERSAAVTRMGANLIRAVSVLTDRVPLVYEGPRKPDELWHNPAFQFRKMVVVQRNTVARMRPIFRKWSLALDFELLEEEMNPSDFTEIVSRAGRSVGLGDARKLGFGRFTSEVSYDDSK